MTDGPAVKAVLYSRKPSPYESFPTLEMQERTLTMWARGMDMDVLRSYRCTHDDHVSARDVVDAMVGFSIRSGVDAIVLWTKDMIDDDSLEVLSEVSYTYGVDIWFVADGDSPWTEDDEDDSEEDDDDNEDDLCTLMDVFVVISKEVAR